MLASWSSWGAIPQVFDETKEDWTAEREQLRTLLSDAEWDAARRTTINAHYTDPALVSAVWQAVTDLGFEGGEVLEPGSGAGTFIGLAPEGTSMTGVELDPLTASISQGLYPQATIRNESFAKTRFPGGYFDAVVGNVPFANTSLHDPEHNPAGHSMHDHFILKSLALTRPGGVMAVLTSRFTLDAGRTSARRDMNALADLVGAVRLPTGTHRRAAGTEAVTDLLIFRRREDGVPPRSDLWENVTRTEQGIAINAYFHANPSHVLGEMSLGMGMHGAETLHVLTDDLTAVPTRLGKTLRGITTEAAQRGLRVSAATAEDLAARQEQVAEPTSLWDGSIVARENGFFVAASGYLAPLAVPKTQAVELRALLELRDQAKALVEAETRTTETTPQMDAQRAELLASWRTYTSTYGALNRYTLARTGRYVPQLDPVTDQPILDELGKPVPSDEEIMRRAKPPVMARFRGDPMAPLVWALENFDDETQAATPAGLLVRRTVTARVVSESAETPAEALAMSLDRTGGVDLDLIATLLNQTPQVAREQLGTSVYDDPATGQLVQAEAYLSGDVLTKLDAAEEAAATDSRYAANVSALREVVPTPLTPAEIDARLGAVWISADVHRQFLAEILRDNSVQVENPLPGQWAVKGYRRGVAATSQWGTERRPATDLAESLMQQQQIVVRDTIEHADGSTRSVINEIETTAAQEKADALQERFEAWVWEDPDRAEALADTYNRTFNCIVLRDYSQAGEALTFPGLSDGLQLRPHQKAAVARMIAEPAVGLFHEVGAGKTFEMVVGATELKRLGLVQKPCVVVPNHMLEQFSREWLQAYPGAMILTANSKDLTGDKRRLFVARAATNDWDAVILTQGAFKLIGVSETTEAEYIDREVQTVRAALEQAKGTENSLSVKRLERALQSREEKFKKKLAIRRDPGLTFEATGIDYLLVDEAHQFKNLATASNIPGASIEGSEAAMDLHMKLEHLRERHGGRVGTLATATPIANSITEAHVMQRYLRPDLLRTAGVEAFDAWAATFGETVTAPELGPASTYRLKTRFAKFRNVPEMLRMWHTFADVKTAEDLQLPTPLIAPRPGDGKREVETVVLPPTPELQDYFAEIVERSEMVAKRLVDAETDNMLMISTDGRKAALDLRVIDPTTVQSGVLKLDRVADRIAQDWEATRDNEYVDRTTGEASPIKGGLQLVFCDLSTPTGSKWNAYDELRNLLVQRGIPRDAIRFIHEARNDAEKARLFAAARSGHVSVLLGSTQKMGVGTNVQDRVVALHHIDCPWRPADIAQRDGRAIRQGNQNAEVSLHRYVVEGSFDAYNWQTIARKATFIAQVTRGRLDAREIDDVGDLTLSAVESTALASGNPLVLEKATADAELTKLRRQEVAHQRAQANLIHTRDQAASTITTQTDRLAQLRAANERTQTLAGDAFSISINGQRIGSRTDAATALAARAQEQRVDLLAPSEVIELAQLGGHTVTASRYGLAQPIRDGRRYVEIALQGVPLSESPVPLEDLLTPNLGLIRALENKTTAIARNIAETEHKIENAQRTLHDATEQIGTPFKHADSLIQATARVAEINARIEAASRPVETTEKAPQTAPAFGGPAGSGRDPRQAIRAAASQGTSDGRFATEQQPRRPRQQGPHRGR